MYLYFFIMYITIKLTRQLIIFSEQKIDNTVKTKQRFQFRDFVIWIFENNWNKKEKEAKRSANKEKECLFLAHS